MDEDRDISAEADLKAVAFWLVMISMAIVVAFIVGPLFEKLGTTWQPWGRRVTGIWVIGLIASTSLFWMGRSLYGLSDSARALAAILFVLWAGGSLIGFAVTLSLRTSNSPLWAMNTACASVMVYLLGRGRSAAVCRGGYRDRFRTARPAANPFKSLWFWIPFVLCGWPLWSIYSWLWSLALRA